MRQNRATVSKRRWMQFSLRTLLILTVLAGLGFHWTAERLRRERALTEISKIGGSIYYESMQSFEYGEVDVKLNFGGFFCLSGIKFFAHPTYSSEDIKFDEASLYYLRYVPRLVSVDLSFMHVGDRAVEHLCALSDLKELALFESDITEENVGRLRAALPNCEIHYYKSPQMHSAAQPINVEIDR